METDSVADIPFKFTEKLNQALLEGKVNGTNDELSANWHLANMAP